MKYIIVTGGVVEGIGKSTVSASIGVLLQQMRVGVSCVRVSAKIGHSPNRKFTLTDSSLAPIYNFPPSHFQTKFTFSGMDRGWIRGLEHTNGSWA